MAKLKLCYFQRIITIFCLLFSVLVAYAATDANISGHVIESSTGEHMPFVNIQIKGTNLGGVTDESGHYFLTNLPLGEQTLVFSMVGYNTVELKVILEENKTIEVNATMEETSVMMDNVVVTSNRYATKQRDASSIVNVVTPQLFALTASSDVAQALDYQTGLRVENSCANCGAPQLRINGLDGQYSQILMDSRPIFSSLASVYGLEQIPAGMVDRIEVIRGGGSALFGANAIGGVVNIITKDPVQNSLRLGEDIHVLRDGSIDNNVTLNGSIVSKSGKMGAYLFGVQRNRQAYDHDGDGFSEIPELQNTTVGFRSFFKITDYIRLTAEYHHMYEFRRGGNLLDRPPHEADIAEQLRHNNDAGSFRFDYYTPDNRHHLQVYSSAQYVDRESYFGTQQNLDAYGASNDITSVSGVQYRLAWMQKTWIPANFTVGAEYTFNRLHDRILGYHRDITQTVHLYGGYFQNEWQNDKLSILVGGRLEKHNLVAKPIFSPRANVRYTPVRNVILRISYAAGYRAPQAYDEDLHVGAVGGEVSLISLDPNLRPEYSHSVCGSVDLYQRWGSVEANLTTEGFFTQLNDVFALEKTGHDEQGNLLLLRTNESGARVAGLNIEGKLVWSHWLTVQLGYTFQKSLYIDPVEWTDNPRIAPQRRMFRTPDNYGYAVVSTEPLKGFTVSLSGKATGSMLIQHFAGYIPEDTEVETPAFVDFGCKLSYLIPVYKEYSIEVNAGVKNILNAYQKDFDHGIDRDASYIYGPSLPRTYFCGVSFIL